MQRVQLLLLVLGLTQALVPSLPPRRAKVVTYSSEADAISAESHEAAPAAPPVEAPPVAKEAPPPAETEDETLMTSLEAALVAEEASAAARSTMAQSSVQKLAAAERLRAEADAALARAADLARQALAQEAEACTTRAAEVKASETTYAEVAAAKRTRVATEKELAASLGEVAKLTPEPELQESLRRLADAKADIVEADTGLADALEAAAQQARDAHAAAKSDADCCAAALAALPAPDDVDAVRTFDWASALADPKVRVDASPAAASDARARAASLSKVVGEQRALRKLAVGDVAAPAPAAPADDAAAPVEVAAGEAGDVGSWLFSK